MASTALTNAVIREATPGDAARLAVLARDTFVDTFGPDNTAEDMALYTASAFGEAIQRAELLDPSNTVFVMERGDEWMGYAMLRDGDAPACVASANTIEIDRLYVAKEHIGARAGAALMRHCLERAAQVNKDTVWLNVWERNERAIRFYERWGFETVGTMPYILGNDHQTDFVMVRHVSEVRD